MAREQLGDVGMHSELEKLKAEATQITLNSRSSVLCDTSMGVICPNVPKTLRRKVFDVLHGNSHPGVRITIDLKKRVIFDPRFVKTVQIGQSRVYSVNFLRSNDMFSLRWKSVISVDRLKHAFMEMENPVLAHENPA
ncbi:hypothetical protein TNCT_158951 [Trichonephila clavata]|uniref:Uncharacterized protein n=1 Tax=Trichonephila clavata TaxID=2740835 RepID=A0A8X6GBA9_TRICU|nr:hypothetical protein TNCT_158951 [Trichonephila clavata]